MQEFAIFLDSISPSSGSVLPAAISAVVLYSPPDDGAPGTVQLLANGVVIGSAAYNESFKQTIQGTLPAGTASGTVNIQAYFTGSSTLAAATSNAIAYTNNATGGGTPPSGPTLALGLSISLSSLSGTPTAASFNVSVASSYTGPAPTGTLSLIVDGAVSGTAAVAPPAQTMSVALNNPATVGAHSVQVQYSGDNNYLTSSSNIATYTVYAAGAATMGAKAQAGCVIVAGATPARADRESGTLASEGYRVTGINIQSQGGGQYDSNTVATLTGKVGGVATRQNLTIALTGTGGISGLTGFDSTTVWDAPPVVTITRWDGAQTSANFLGY